MFVIILVFVISGVITGVITDCIVKGIRKAGSCGVFSLVGLL